MGHGLVWACGGRSSWVAGKLASGKELRLVEWGRDGLAHWGGVPRDSWFFGGSGFGVRVCDEWRRGRWRAKRLDSAQGLVTSMGWVSELDAKCFRIGLCGEARASD
jgi:hypothetical protein